MVQAKTFVPKAKPVIEVVGDNEFVMVPNPETIVQTPVPTVGVFAVMNVLGLEVHSVWLIPALDIVGTSLTDIVTLDTEAAHGAFEMVHAKTLLPTAKPVILDVGESEFVITPLPETKLHAPAPTNAVLAAIVVVGFEIQSN